MTFRQWGELWTSGELHRLFGDDVRLKKTAKQDEGRLAKYVYPVIGSRRMSEFEGAGGLELADSVKARLPKNDEIEKATLAWSSLCLCLSCPLRSVVFA